MIAASLSPSVALSVALGVLVGLGVLAHALSSAPARARAHSAELGGRWPTARVVGDDLLLARLRAVVTTTDCAAVRLGTSQHTDGFYRRLGFTVERREQGGIAPGLHAVEMRLELTDAARSSILARWRAVSG